MLHSLCVAVISVFKGFCRSLLCRLRNCQPDACVGIPGSWRST